jgi:hypothetical protein
MKLSQPRMLCLKLLVVESVCLIDLVAAKKINDNIKPLIGIKKIEQS